jgi:hypothetical protein
MELEAQRQEKILLQKSLVDEATAVQQREELMGYISDLVKKEASRDSQSQSSQGQGPNGVHIDVSMLDASAECSGDDEKCKMRSEIQDKQHVDSVMLESQQSIRVNVGAYLNSVHKNTWLSAGLNAFLCACFGTDVVHSNRSLVEVVVWCIGFCFLLFVILLIMFVVLVTYLANRVQ